MFQKGKKLLLNIFKYSWQNVNMVLNGVFKFISMSVSMAFA